jgi:hypothetical protein
VYLKSDRMRVAVNSEMRTRIDDLLGPGNVRLLAAPPKSAPSKTTANGNGRYAAHR